MRQFMASVAIVSLIGFSGCSQAGASDQQNRADIEKIVKDYLLENPEIVRDALIALHCLLYTSPSPRDGLLSRMPSSA